MIYTARQLADLQRAGGAIILPYGARLTPLAKDWARQRKISIGYGEAEIISAALSAFTPTEPHPHADANAGGAPNSTGTASLLWWVDGPCGAAKAALAGLQSQTPLALRQIAIDPARSIEVAKLIAREVASGNANGGIVMVKNASAMLVWTNHCPSLRAVWCSSLHALDEATRNVTPNVLIVEYPGITLPQIRNLLNRFARGIRPATGEIKRQIEELRSCG